MQQQKSRKRNLERKMSTSSLKIICYNSIFLKESLFAS